MTTVKKPVEDLKQGDVLVWAGSESGATVTQDFDLDEAVHIEWVSTIDDSQGKRYTARLEWKRGGPPVNVVEVVSS
jgi:hypothetical protein